MSLRFRDLVMDVLPEVGPLAQMAGPPPKPCGCTATALDPGCTGKSQKPGQPRCPKASAVKPPKKFEALDLLRQQLRLALAQGA
jgi:hypothetical protein